MLKLSQFKTKQNQLEHYFKIVYKNQKTNQYLILEIKENNFSSISKTFTKNKNNKLAIVAINVIIY